MNALPNFWLIIPAAGIGTRMGASLPKQYLTVATQTILEHTADCFLTLPNLLGAVIATSAQDSYWPTLALAQHPKVINCLGGKERADTVLLALKTLQSHGALADDWVLVHDAARPNLAQNDLFKLLYEVSQSNAAGGILAYRAKDTLKLQQPNTQRLASIAKTIDRSVIWHALTPQMFRLNTLLECLEYALQKGLNITDESSAIEAAGLSVRLVEGRSDNYKITYPEDLVIFQQQLATTAES